MRIVTLYIVLLSVLCSANLGAQSQITGYVFDKENGSPLSEVSVLLGDDGPYTETNEAGQFQFSGIGSGKYRLTAFHAGYASFTILLEVDERDEVELDIQLAGLSVDLQVVEVAAESSGNFGVYHLRNVEGVGIYAGRKTEVVELSNLVANLATNNPREIYQGIAGLNIWENDGAGLQLSIGARGLNPNRTSNFNTRQNGYDISADALGYPESYYTPPTQALDRIEVVRGAASLQYGPQFGGLLNFIFKEGPKDRKVQFTSENTVGSFGFLSTFNSLGGQVGDLNYYGFFQRKQGDGWRENSGFHQNTAYIGLRQNLGENLRIGLEYTHMNYLAQQAGGLQDFAFAQEAQQSIRSRNWFRVNWNLAAFTLDYQLSDRTKINNRSFYLDAGRDALGELGPINRPDPLRERDLIQGSYRNFGSETRLITRYSLGKQMATFLTGVRYYQGNTYNRQGDANPESGPDFEFLNPDNLERSEYYFPSRNVAVFAENLFNLGEKWTLTPGLRFEYIRTASEGFYKERVFSGGQVIFEQKVENNRENSRHFLLAGLGAGYRPRSNLELYGNFSQNYRSINFSDLAVINPNLVVDSLLADERGYNADLGIRGSVLDDAISFDVSVFYLGYMNRIGIAELVVPDPVVIEKLVAFRTNIGNARVIGLEAYLEGSIWKIIRPEATAFDLHLFANFSLLNGRYTDGQTAFVGNEVELIPPISLKTGLRLKWKSFHAGYLISYVGAHYSDATNAEFVADATRGIVPSYVVQDLSLSYTYKFLRLQAGANNLADARYFTRRAAAYPGPGIIPADGRSFYCTLGVRF